MRPKQKIDFQFLVAKTFGAFILISILTLTSLCDSRPVKSQFTENRPNIIYILADDLGFGDISFTTQEKFETPNIDQLAREGLFFNQHYSGSAICAPSRSSLLTGLHTGHTFIRANKKMETEGQYPLESRAITVAETLKEVGYVTGAFGKWGLGYPGSEGDPNNQGFDEFYGYNCQRLSHNYYPRHLWHNQTKKILKGNRAKRTETYAPDLIHSKALDFIEKNKDSSFFLYYPSTIPHAELAAPERLMEQYRSTFDPETPYNGVDAGRMYKNGQYGSQKEPHAAFAAMVHLLDEQVGEIRRKLEELGIAENTIIIFSSDNGPHFEGGGDPVFFNSNANLRGYKRDLYEGGIRVPMIAYWPGTIQPNTKTNHISAFWDVLPTVAEIAGIDAPDNIDGISFFPTLIGENQRSHEHLYWELHGQGQNDLQAVRLGDWKGIRLKVTGEADSPIELYNLGQDVGEENDISNANPDITRRIQKIMNEEHQPSKVFPFKHEKSLKRDTKIQ